MVTGASTGIGWATVAALVGRNVRVLASVRADGDAGRLRESFGAAVDVIRLDLTDDSSIRSALAPVRRLGALVNNAGTAVPGPLEHLSPERFRRQLEVNLVGQLAVTQAALPALRAHGRGARIVNVGSVAGRVAGPMLGAYHASKFGLAGFSEALRAELAPEGIQVVLVEPGVVDTPIWDRGADRAGSLLALLPPEGRARYGGRIDRLRRGAGRAADSGMPASAVADVIVNMLAARRPPPRRLVGATARAAGWVDRLPDPLRFRVLDRVRR